MKKDMIETYLVQNCLINGVNTRIEIKENCGGCVIEIYDKITDKETCLFFNKDGYFHSTMFGADMEHFG